MANFTAAQIKEKILETIRLRGPSLPVHIAKTVDQSPLFASAFLSELYSEGKIRISHMKVGSSPLYILPGQEPQLENFTEHLNQREKEAVELLKNNRVLNDEEQTPVIRVALRSIPDFAIPVKIKINEEIKQFWKYFLVNDEEIKSLAEQKTPKIEKIPEIKKEAEQKEHLIEIVQKKQEKKKIKKEVESEFSSKLKEHLRSKDIEVITSFLEKKKEFMAKVRIDTIFGKQEYFLIAKDKKKVSEMDLTAAYEKAQSEKMPALFICPGDLDKKAFEHIQSWKNLIKFDKLK